MAQVDTWSHPKCRPEVVQTMISGVDRYNHQNIGLLEEYLASQLEEDTYDCLANLAILKLYQFGPSLVENQNTIFQILLQTIAHRPFNSDFSLACALLTERFNPIYSDEETIKTYETLSELSRLLSERKFGAFWDSLRKQRELTDMHPRLEHIVRRSIAQECIATVFQTLPAERMRRWLGFASAEAAEEKELLASFGWTIDDKGTVRIPRNAENAPVTKVQRETVALERIGRLLVKAQ